jgi:hypothetical protein
MKISLDDQITILMNLDLEDNENTKFIDRDEYVELETSDGAEYYIYENYEAAKEAAKESMRNLFDDIGITAWNKDFIESIVPSEIVDFVAPAYEAVKNNNDYSLSRAGAWEQYLDEIFEESINTDGLAHTLAAYDGEEITVDDYHIYRWN